jgi:hypothetical protein
VLNTLLDQLKAWAQSHTSAVTAIGLLFYAAYELTASDYAGAGKSVLAAATALHLWSATGAEPVSE